MQEEGDETEQWHDQANSLPVSSIASIWLGNISFDDSNEEDPEDAWDEVLDSDTPVESKGWLPCLYAIWLAPAELGHGVCNPSDTAHTNIGIPLAP